MAHTFDPANAEMLEEVGRYRYCSRDELVGMLPTDGDSVVVDMGSGTGFYTTDVAPYVGTVYALDVQPVMHAKFLDKGVPENVDLVTAEAADLPLASDLADAAYSTMTFHEFAGTGALSEIARVLVPGGRLAVVDWSAAGVGEAGPPPSELHDLASATALAESAGFTVRRGEERPETFALVADAPASSVPA